MIRRVIAWCAHNPLAVVLLTAAALAGSVFAMKHAPLDAIPDLSDTQVIVYSRWDRSPDIIEDQVTYPVVSALLGAPKVKAVRGFSDFGFSYVYVIFEDGVDIYWARSRVLEYLSKVLPSLPEGVQTELGPDATGVGWVYQYALVDKTGRHDLQQLRSLQDWYLRYQLQAVPGVAEVAAFGGFQKQYQVTVDPNALSAYGIPLMKVVEAVRDGNAEVGGRLLEFAGAEFMVRGRGYIKTPKDIEDIVVGRDMKGTPVLLRSVAKVAIGPEIRRGIGDLDGAGDVVGAIVVMRHGENALNVIARVKAKIEDLKTGLPEGVEIVTTYDRSGLIKDAIKTLTHELVLELVVVSLVILLFLWHVPSALVPIVTIPVSVILTFVPMWLMGMTSNIMSLTGIAISIGVLVDGAIVEVENAYKKIERWLAAGKPGGDFHAVRLAALQEVGPSVFFSLLVIAVAFIPVFTLVDQEGRLFKPLAYTKTLAMAMAAVLAVTLDPAIRMLFSRIEPFAFKPRALAELATFTFVGKYYPEEKHPVSKVLFRVYEPVCRWVLARPGKVVAGAALLVLTSFPVYLSLGSEFMPPLYEGTLLYMPTTLPGLSVTEAGRLLQTQDELIKSFPEVASVHGKAGRAATSTDPAPFSMMETTIVLKPREEWREKPRWYSSWAPEPLKTTLLRPLWSDRIGHEELIAEMDQKLRFAGVTNAWTMPIKGRIDMLSSGVRTPVGIKILGADLEEIENLGALMEQTLREVPGTRSVFAERAAGGYFVDFELKREQLARYGLSVKEVQMVVMSAVGGEPITTTIEGRERYSVNVRYPRELREDLEQLARVLVPTMSGAQVPLGQLADIVKRTGPSMIRNENGLVAGYVFVDVAGRDIGSYVKDAKKAVDAAVKLPAGYTMLWSGQYENMERVAARLKVVVPLTLFIIVVLLYLNTGSWAKAGIVLLAVPFSALGCFWLLWALGYNMSIAVWVGIIALLGLDAETGVFMLLFLDLGYYDRVKRGLMKTREDLAEAIIEGAVKRVRPKMMTVGTTFIAMLPILWSTGTGADLMKRIAAPMAGGLLTSFIMELIVYPAVYDLWKWYGEMQEGRRDPAAIPIPELAEH
ncbi:MAG: efflux RND transporter permease subunit [Elusimicrobia bacterium]|nr:efflux RND transporter permease subunit [Elusimicrobiota bacterium]